MGEDRTSMIGEIGRRHRCLVAVKLMPIAPIRKLGEAKLKATRQEAADVAQALGNIRTDFMPKRAKQKVLTKALLQPVNAESPGLFVALTVGELMDRD